jgi:serine/threonine protein kinase
MLMGSPGWVAPERLAGGQAVAASDIFGWGQLVAYAGTGRHPFGPGDPQQLTERTLTLAPDLTGLAEPLHSLASAALSKDPERRPTASALLTELLVPRQEPTAEMAVATLWETSFHASLATAPLAAAPPKKRRSRIPAAPFLWMGAGALVAAAILVVQQPWQGKSPAQRVEVTVPATVTQTARQADPNPGVRRTTPPVSSVSSTPKPTLPETSAPSSSVPTKTAEPKPTPSTSRVSPPAEEEQASPDAEPSAP